MEKLLAPIRSFISGLKDHEKKLLFCALIVIVFALFDRLLISPNLAKSSLLEEEISNEKKGIEQDLRFLGYKDKIISERENLQGYLTKTLPNEEELISAFLKRLESLAGEANIVIGKISPSAGRVVGDTLRYGADLDCSGKFADIVTFMHKINSSKDLLKVTKYTLQGKKTDADDNMKASLTIEKAIILEGNEKPVLPSAKDAPASN